MRQDYDFTTFPEVVASAKDAYAQAGIEDVGRYAAINADVILRASDVLQAALEQGTQMGPNDIAILIDSRHQKSSAPDYNLRVKYGNAELIGLLEQTLPVW